MKTKLGSGKKIEPKKKTLTFGSAARGILKFLARDFMLDFQSDFSRFSLWIADKNRDFRQKSHNFGESTTPFMPCFQACGVFWILSLFTRRYTFFFKIGRSSQTYFTLPHSVTFVSTPNFTDISVSFSLEFGVFGFRGLLLFHVLIFLMIVYFFLDLFFLFPFSKKKSGGETNKFSLEAFKEEGKTWKRRV